MTADPQAPCAHAPERTRTPDAVPKHWVEAMPAALRPWLRLVRLDRPIGTWLLFWPCVFGLALGAAAQGRGFPNPWYVLLTGVGSVVMRGAGCVYNDIVDRDYDAQVARTRVRPIASGAIGVKAAWAFASVLGLVGLAILLMFNRVAVLLGIASLVLIAAYPLMKRITWWPQAWLGLTFNWGVPFGFAAQTGHLGPAAYLFYAGTFFWTMGYDTIYAHQDKADDMLIGVKSSAIKLGPRTIPWMYAFYALSLALMILGGVATGLRIVFVSAMLIAGAHLIWQIRALDIDDPVQCLKLFKSNRETGAIVSAAIVLGALAGI
jgi:4-hydroxybenzoate polyprenyltransferase